MDTLEDIRKQTEQEVKAQWREQNRIDSAKAIKAMNQMLEDACRNMIAKFGTDMRPDDRMTYMALKQSIEENYQRAYTDLGMTRSQIDGIEYNTRVEKKYIDDYEEGLRRRGLTKEDVENKGALKTEEASSPVRISTKINGDGKTKSYSFQKKKNQ